jgi:hypothetical protein
LAPGESKEEYDELVSGYTEYFTPEGSFEHDLIADVVDYQWRKLRVARAMNLKHAVDPMVQRLSDLLGKGGKADDLERHICEIIREKSQPSAATKLVQAKTQDTIDAVEAARKVVTGQPETTPNAGENAAASPSKKVAVESPHLNLITRQVVERYFQVDDMDKYLKLDAALDARIEKTLGRLVRAKEYRLRYVPKLIDAKPVGSADSE